MASIERTAYPRFKRHPTAEALNDLYTPTTEELAFARKSARSEPHQLTLLVLLKSFQRLGYFPKLEDVPRPIINHIQSGLRLGQVIQPGYDEPRTLYRHDRAIRDFLQVKACGKEARRLAIRAVYEAAQVKDNPADLINVALETLIKERYELPAFSTLDRLVRRVRTLVNRRFFQAVFSRLTASDIANLDALLLVDEHTHRSLYHRLKQLPKQPTLSHLQEWLDHLEWLTALGDAAEPLAGLPHLKVKHFAAEARALDAGELKDFLPAKRYTLLICLIQRMRVQARDSLAAMFIKRMNKIQQKGKEQLDRLRLQYKEKTAELVSLLADVVTACENSPSDEATGQQVRSLLTARGPASQLLEDCETITAYNADAYQPLLWRYYRAYRRTLFRLVPQLALSSTSQDQSLVGVLKVVLDYEGRRREWLDEIVDLSFAPERWQRTVTRIQNGELLLNVGGHVKTYKNEQKPGFATAAYFEIGLPADSNASLYRRYCM